MSHFLVQPRLRPGHLAGVLVAAAIALAPALPSAQARPSRHVLFIGNSYTAANNLAEVVAGIAEARQAGPVIVPSMALRGGQMLDWHLHYGPAMPALEAPAHDITDVVLQEQSTLGAGDAQDDASGGQHLTIADPAEFYAGVRGLVKRIRARGATPVLFMTWARRDWPEDLEKLQKAYVSIGRELNVKVAPVGVAWAEAQRRIPTLVMYVADGSHPSWAGSYLAACVLYATITGQDPRGAPALISGHFVDRRSGEIDRSEVITLVNLEPELARDLQTIAWETVSGRRW
jgi:hypothetical protein